MPCSALASRKKYLTAKAARFVIYNAGQGCLESTYQTIWSTIQRPHANGRHGFFHLLIYMPILFSHVLLLLPKASCLLSGISRSIGFLFHGERVQAWQNQAAKFAKDLIRSEFHKSHFVISLIFTFFLTLRVKLYVFCSNRSASPISSVLPGLSPLAFSHAALKKSLGSY